MLRARQEVPLTPSWPDIDTRVLRARLILEECLETVTALGCNIMVPVDSGAGAYFVEIKHDDVKITPSHIQPKGTPEDLVEVADGCCDIRVVTTGTLSACGLADGVIQQEVDQNNLEKFKPGHMFREDGKLIKPPNHKKPNLHRFLFSMYTPAPTGDLEASSPAV